jgi:RNA polymerase sigma-70 factor (ECF subfamily)
VRVFRFLVRFVGDKSAAEDLVSEVFLDVWRQAGRFQGRSQVTTWLLALARNKALSALRRRPTEELDEEVAAAIEDPQ